ncbi:hypothetical protein HOJ01_02195 [bacterium]|jgi:pyruvate kinase|nr:hypothetical protein [bacterium]MBT6293594.1 hypothetical protein [bacterium]
MKEIIITTLGPSSHDISTIKELIKAGTSHFRLNMSHGTIADHKTLISYIEAANKNLKTKTEIIIDLPGPKFRIEKVNELKSKQNVYITDQNLRNSFSINIKEIYDQIQEGQIIYIRDGEIKLKVEKINFDEKIIQCEYLVYGEIKPENGLNFIESNLKIPIIKPQDICFLELAESQNITNFMLSFVNVASDIQNAKKLLPANSTIFTKIETKKAISNLSKIIKESNYLVIARGDLGVETDLFMLPQTTLKIIEKAKKEKIPCVYATEILKSMITNSRPSRAEVTDMYFAITNGVRNFLVSNETAIGLYPIKCIETIKTMLSKH